MTMTTATDDADPAASPAPAADETPAPSASAEDNTDAPSPLAEGGALPGADDPEKRQERLEQNRISARESRKRKKNMIEELQRTVITLSRENKELNERNEALRTELVDLGTQHPGVVNIQALMSCSNGGNAGVADAAAAITVPQHAPASGANPQQAGSVALPQAAPATAPPQSSATGGFDPQQLAMMQQMMALQQAGMMQPLMGWGGVGG